MRGKPEGGEEEREMGEGGQGGREKGEREREKEQRTGVTA